MLFTLEELERRAYIEGRTADAWALGQAVDKITDEVLDLEMEVDLLQQRNNALEAQIAELRREL